MVGERGVGVAGLCVAHHDEPALRPQRRPQPLRQPLPRHLLGPIPLSLLLSLLLLWQAEDVGEGVAP